MSAKRPETNEDILSRSTALSQGFATGGLAYGKRYIIDLAAHMAECDTNYQRLMQLFPRMRDDDEKRIGLLPGDQGIKVVLAVLERGPYTTLLHLAQHPRQNWGSSPNMRIRLYHDAKSAEVVEYQHENRFHGAYEYPNKRMRQRDEKVQLNKFLGEYLSLCLAIGMTIDEIDLPVG